MASDCVQPRFLAARGLRTVESAQIWRVNGFIVAALNTGMDRRACPHQGREQGMDPA